MTQTIFQTLTADGWQSGFPTETQTKATKALEYGQLVYFPHLAFHLLPAEMPLLSERYASGSRKNISYHPLTQKIRGVKRIPLQESQALHAMLARFAEHSRNLVENLFPLYQQGLQWGRTSYRPVQVTDRAISYRKDDRRLHVDAFPSSPNQGKRILRVFCNINPHGEDRIWRIGEPFEQVAQHFLPQLKKPLKGGSALLKFFRLTKSQRTLYDHYMLQIHDSMKGDEHYQKVAKRSEIHLPPGSTWIVQTDQVSHAAMQGQFLLEQTFYLPVEAMQDPRLSPLRILERLKGIPLT